MGDKGSVRDSIREQAEALLDNTTMFHLLMCFYDRYGLISTASRNQQHDFCHLLPVLDEEVCVDLIINHSRTIDDDDPFFHENIVGYRAEEIQRVFEKELLGKLPMFSSTRDDLDGVRKKRFENPNGHLCDNIVLNFNDSGYDTIIKDYSIPHQKLVLYSVDRRKNEINQNIAASDTQCYNMLTNKEISEYQDKAIQIKNRINDNHTYDYQLPYSLIHDEMENKFKSLTLRDILPPKMQERFIGHAVKVLAVKQQQGAIR